MKRLVLCVVPFFAVSISGMGFFSSGDATHKKFIDSIYDGAQKGLLVTDKASMSFGAWDSLVTRVKEYVKNNDTGFNDTDFNQVYLKKIELEEFFKKSPRNIGTINDLNDYIASLKLLYNQYLKAAKNVDASSEKRRAKEALAALVNGMQLGAADLQQDILEQMNKKAASEGKTLDVAAQAKQVAATAEELRKSSLRPGKIDKLFERFKKEKLIVFASDKEFENIKLDIQKIKDLDDIAFLTIQPRVRDYADKYNREALKLDSFLQERINNVYKVKKSSDQAVSIGSRELILELEKSLDQKSKSIQSDIAKIEKSIFAKKEKRLALELYKIIIDRILNDIKSLKKTLWKKPIPMYDVLDIEKKVRAFAGKNFDSFQARLQNQLPQWNTIIRMVMLESGGIENKAELTQLKDAVLGKNKDAIQKYRQEAIKFQSPTTVYGAIMKTLSTNLVV